MVTTSHKSVECSIVLYRLSVIQILRFNFLFLCTEPDLRSQLRSTPNHQDSSHRSSNPDQSFSIRQKFCYSISKSFILGYEPLQCFQCWHRVREVRVSVPSTGVFNNTKSRQSD